MIQTVLVANRGEIACRVLSTARAMGLRTVAVHSGVDAQARHVTMADQAVALSGPGSAQGYLDGEAIIAAARATGAQAIHPGYGFLSENPDFVEAVADAGLIFVGPSAAAIRAMGLKDAAKALMMEAGVPVVPGYHGADQDPEHLAQAAQDIGYPVLIKAVAGGGGKGMRLVETPSDFVPALDSARREAQAAFGNDRVLIEKFISAPRHIEIQVFGDAHGTVVHLYERDCSLQRRHQKVIEEAPAPGMTAEMRAAMGQAAVRAAQATGYCGAGTVEFIVDGSGPLRPDGFWFMEMNTRLQVEHPVTEEVTGVDLVEWQLRVAQGQPVPLGQDEIPLKGHAVEARLYAEDAAAGFLPAVGCLTHLRFGSGARIETGVRQGDEISPHYDPMIAKIVTTGADRAAALGAMARSLDATEIAGTVTNIGFLARLIRHEGFAAGRVDTGLIGRDLEDLVARGAPPKTVVALAAVQALDLTGPLALDSGFALWAPLEWPVTLIGQDDAYRARVVVKGPETLHVHLDDTVVELQWQAGWQGAGLRGAVRHGAEVTVFAEETWVFAVPDPLARGGEGATSGDHVEAPMPGLVKALFVEVGAEIAAGDRLAVLEAMKMEHAMTAPRDGRIAEILVATGDQVPAGARLMTLEEAPE